MINGLEDGNLWFVVAGKYYAQSRTIDLALAENYPDTIDQDRWQTNWDDEVHFLLCSTLQDFLIIAEPTIAHEAAITLGLYDRYLKDFDYSVPF